MISDEIKIDFKMQGLFSLYLFKSKPDSIF